MLVCIVLLIGLVTLFACNKSDVADKDGQTKVIVKIQDEDGSSYKENVAFSDLFTLSLQKEGYTGRLYRDADFLKPLTKDSKVKNGDTVYVKWKINQYTITFVLGNGEADVVLTQNYGTEITAPENPVREGYTFDGWDKTIPETVPAEDVTITARWTVNRYTITFVLGNGEADVVLTQDYGTAITAPTPKMSGYTFDGWDKAVPETMPANDVTITAKWKINQYTITFVLGNGKDNVVLTQNYGTAITAPENPVREGYTFGGWDKTIPETVPAEDVTITAKWTVNQYTITFVLGNGKDNVVLTQNYGTAITAPTPKMSGYTFAGWDKTVPETVPAENLTITAQWTVNQYTITFVLGNGKDNVVLTQNYGTEITAPENPVREGYTFDGWDKAVPETVPAEDVTITAKWKTRQYTLTFIDHNGGKVYGTSLEWGALVEDEYYTANGKVEENNIITGPFQYEGWYDQSDTEKTIIEDFSELTMPTRDLTYVLKLSLMDSAIGDFKVNTPADFTFTESNTAKFTITPNEGTTLHAGVTYKYIWTINKDNVFYKAEETTESSLTLQNLAAGEYLANVKIVASMENCGSVENDFTADKTLIVSRADISGIEVVKDFTMTYGDKTAKIGISGSGLREGDVITYKKDEVGEEFKENVDLWALNAGEYGYYVRISRGDNYNPYTSGRITVTIKMAEVTATVTPDKDTLTYGDTLPSLTATINGETYKIESGKYTLQLKDGMQAITGSVANNVGTYNINVDVKKSGLRENYPNYEITVETKGTIKINEAKLTVTVWLDKTELTYGEDSPIISYTFSGLKSSDKEDDFTITKTELAEKLDVGTYTATVTLSGDKTKFYNITVIEADFIVKQRDATITINTIDNIVYGDKVPVLSASVKDVLDGDKLSYTLETDYTVGKKPGNYNVKVVFDKNAEANKNYAITTTVKTFYVGTKALEIKLDSNVSVGNVAKTYTVEVGSQDLVIGELATGDVIEGSVSITSSEGGTFVDDKAFQKNIVIKNAAGEVVTAYYEIKYNLKVVFVKYAFEINADDKTVTYNGAPQNVDLVTWDASKTYKVTYGTAANECNAESLRELNCINAGTYTIYFKVVDTANGAEEKGSVKFTISPAKVIVKVKDVTITYGDTPKFEYTVTGLVEGETLSGDAVYSGEGTDAGDYEISVSGLSASDNYNVSFVPGKLTIDKKPDTVTWNIAESYVYSPAGQTLPTATYDGKTANLIFTKDGKACEFKNAGTYTVTIADDNNYDLTGSETTKTIVINKARYTAAPALSLSGTYAPDKTLGKYALSKDFTWVNPDEVPVCTKTEYAAKYNMDPANYEDFETTVTLVLQKATVTLAQNLFEFNYDGASHEIKAVVTYNGVALDTSLYSLTYDGETSKTYTDAGTHRTLVTMEADNYDLPKNTYVYVKVKGVKLKKGNEVTYHTIEDALFNSQSGYTIEFINGVKEVSFAPSDVAEAIYADNAFRMVKGGVTLILASDEDSSAKIGKPTYGAGSARYVDTDSSKIKYKLILNKSTVLEVYGNILIQGLLGVNGQGLSGHTSGNHSQIINNGTIKLNSGANLDLRGYIKGTGTVEAREGAKVYSPFVIRDFRGGTSSKKTYEEGVSPFNVYEMPNIQCLYRVEYGATHTAYMDLYSGTLNKHFSSSQNVIANNTAIIILKDKSAGLIKTYDRESEKSNLTIYGNVELGDLSLDWSGLPIKMSKVRFPIPWNYSINIGDGIETTNLTAKYDYKIMTGATINVNKKATVNLTGTVVVYKSFTDVAYGNCVYPNKEAGKLNIEGLLNVTGGIAGELFGRAGGQVVIGNKATLSLSSREGYAKRNPVIVSFIEVATISATAELVNADGNKITAETDRTYNYNNGTWQ